MSHLDDVAYLLGDNYRLLLDREETLFFAGPNDIAFGSWTGTNASLVAEETFRYESTYNSLRVTPLTPGNGVGGTTTFSLEHAPKIVPQSFTDDSAQFHAFIYPTEEMRVSITIEDSNGLSLTSEETILPPNFWSLLKSSEFEITEQTSVLRIFTRINFTNSSASQAHVHVAQPILTNSYGFTENSFLRETVTYLPRFLLETDSVQTDPSFPMIRMMDVGLAYANRGYEQIEQFRYRDTSTGRDDSNPDTLSQLVNPDTTNVDYLRWLGQFVGVTDTPVRTGGTPWGYLPTTWSEIHTSIDPDVDVTFSISSIDVNGAVLSSTPSSLAEGYVVSISGTVNYNGQFQIVSISGTTLELEPALDFATENTGTVTLVDNSWTEIEFFDTRDANYEISQRNLITTQRTGLRAGTKQAIVDTLEQVLLYTKSYLYAINPTRYPWMIFIETLTDETPEGVNGVESQYLVRELNEVKPMGFIIYHRCRDVLGDSITPPPIGGQGGFIVTPQG